MPVITANTLRRRWSMRLAICLALFILSSPATRGQAIVPQAVPPAPMALEAPMAPDPTASVSGPVLQSGVHPSIAPGFWIVSTHESPQSFDGTMPQFRPDVLRYDECIGYRHSSLDELAQSLIPGIPVSITVHGSFVDWPSVYSESSATWRWLSSGCPDRPLQMIYFTWPSYRPLGPIVQLDVGILGRRASRNGFYLADLIRYIPTECPLSLVGHSHGTRVIASGLHLMGGGQLEGYRHVCATCAGRRIRVVFAASAIDHDWLNPDQRFNRALYCTECLLNLQNRHDLALKLYPLRKPSFSSRALGHCGFTSNDRMKLGGNGARVYDLDVSSQIGHHHLWPSYVEKPWLARSISNYVFFPDAVPELHMTKGDVTTDLQLLR